MNETLEIGDQKYSFSIINEINHPKILLSKYVNIDTSIKSLVEWYRLGVNHYYLNSEKWTEFPFDITNKLIDNCEEFSSKVILKDSSMLSDSELWLLKYLPNVLSTISKFAKKCNSILALEIVKSTTNR